MKKEMSLYLDAVRFFAALAVFLSHFSLARLSGGLLWQVAPLGDEAVAVFFVLSGFVIAHATDTRETSPTDYGVNRIARIYSVAVPVLALTLLLDHLGNVLRPDIYRAGGYVQDLSFARFFTGLTFSNELWSNGVSQGTNRPYWSMGYEVPYYAIYGIAIFAPSRWRVLSICAALALCGPSITLALPIWVAGVLAYRLCKKNLLSPRWGIFVFFGSIGAWIVYEIVVWRIGRPVIDPTRWGLRRVLVQDYLIAGFFVLNVIGFNAAARQLGGLLMRWANTIRWLAGSSFTLYLFHVPMLHFLVACMPWPATDPRSRSLVFTLALLVILLLARVTEHKKKAWRNAIAYVWNHIRSKPALGQG